MAETKSETKQAKSLLIKEKVFNVALTMMKEVGFENVTVRHLCEKSDISIGMFYRNFSSKEDLLAFYYVKTQASYEMMKDQHFIDCSVKEKIIIFYSQVCQFTQELGVDFCRHFFSSKNQLMNTSAFGNKLIEITNTILRDAINDGYSIPDNRTPEDVSKELCVIVKGAIFDWSSNEGNYDMSEFTIPLLKRYVMYCL